VPVDAGVGLGIEAKEFAAGWDDCFEIEAVDIERLSAPFESFEVFGHSDGLASEVSDDFVDAISEEESTVHGADVRFGRFDKRSVQIDEHV